MLMVILFMCICARACGRSCARVRDGVWGRACIYACACVCAVCFRVCAVCFRMCVCACVYMCVYVFFPYSISEALHNLPVRIQHRLHDYIIVCQRFSYTYYAGVNIIYVMFY